MSLDFRVPDQRRAGRFIVQAIVVFAMLGLVWWFADKLDQAGLKYILGWAMLIILVGTIGYIMENGLRSFKWTGPFGGGGEVLADAPAAAQAVAEVAAAKADEITEQAKP